MDSFRPLQKKFSGADVQKYFFLSALIGRTNRNAIFEDAAHNLHISVSFFTVCINGTLLKLGVQMRIQRYVEY